MTQLIASYHYDRKKLGPAVAQGKLNELFEEEAYSVIRGTRAAHAYQLYLLAEIIDRTLKRLAAKKQYIANVKGYVDLCTFACVCRILREAGMAFGNEKSNEKFEAQYDGDDPAWKKAVKGLIDHIYTEFRLAGKRALREEGSTLTPANYFKSVTLIGELLAKPIPRRLRTIADWF
jgi:hypothetical protein